MTGPQRLAERTASLTPFRARVASADQPALGVVRLRLESLDGAPLPPWTPGAHIDVVLPDGLIRQYSLCGDPGSPYYEIAVLLEVESRGGSRQLHDPGVLGTVLDVRGPRNHFALEPAESYLFIAGGIGVTPLVAMARRAAADGVPWRFVYGGRTRASMALLTELEALAAGGTGTLEVVPQDEVGIPDLDGVLATTGPRELVYCCGPDGLLTAVEQRCAVHAAGRLRIERFTAPISEPPVADDQVADRPVQVELRRSGLVVDVPADRTILQVVEESLPDVMYSCEEGYCGSCEAVVLEGEPDHRDTVLSDAERAANATMMICVSRARSERLVLDL